MDTVKNTLQPMLKVKIDIVSDFDLGLKDVFEKRPATVFIQDQIAGVTGESVARHIQMLLGSGAPLFIFMHEGRAKIKPINGLFEYLIDLSQEETKIVADIQGTLKSLLGTQWEKINIPPKIDRAVIRSSVSLPEGSRAVADQLVDEFLSDLDGFGSAYTGNRALATDSSTLTEPADEPFHVVSTSYDQLVEMSSETNSNLSITEVTAVAADETSVNNQSDSSNMSDLIEHNQQSILPEQTDTHISSTAHIFNQTQSIQRNIISTVPKISKQREDVTINPISRSVSEKALLQQVAPADFLISGEEKPADDLNSEDLLHIFEDNYYSHSGRWKRYAIYFVVLMVCISGIFWYLLKQKPQLLSYISRSSMQPVVVVPATRTPKPSISIQQPVSTSVQKAGAPKLPSFIPQAGLDRSFAAQNPGWERYVETALEFRVYFAAGKIKALQVLGLKNHVISESKLKSVLIELLGDGEYRVISREQKFGFHVSRALIGEKSELLIYRKKSTMRAFVVSLD